MIETKLTMHSEKNFYSLLSFRFHLCSICFESEFGIDYWLLDFGRDKREWTWLGMLVESKAIMGTAGKIDWSSSIHKIQFIDAYLPYFALYP
jgi:hypothetical protein